MGNRRRGAELLCVHVCMCACVQMVKKTFCIAAQHIGSLALLFFSFF